MSWDVDSVCVYCDQYLSLAFWVWVIPLISNLWWGLFSPGQYFIKSYSSTFYSILASFRRADGQCTVTLCHHITLLILDYRISGLKFYWQMLRVFVLVAGLLPALQAVVLWVHLDWSILTLCFSLSPFWWSQMLFPISPSQLIVFGHQVP